jgi:hypothetical protein
MEDGGSSREAKRDELARRCALRYASSTMHFIRFETIDWDHTDFPNVWFQEALTYHGHPGKPALAIDVAAQAHLERVVKADHQPPVLGRFLVLGEEVSQPEWNPGHPGIVSIVRCDPVDGTSALAHSAEGFASVVTIESRQDSGREWRHLAGAIVRSDGLAISWSRSAVLSHYVVLDLTIEPKANYTPLISNYFQVPQLRSADLGEVYRKILSDSGAAVAAQSSKRRQQMLSRYSAIITNAEYFDFKAGNPSVWQLCKGLLGWVIEPNWTTIHDSIYLWPFVSVGGKVVDHNYEPVEILKLIEEHAGPESLEKAVPPYIAYADDDSLEFIRNNISTDGA